MQAAIRNDDMPLTWRGLSIDERNPEDDASEFTKEVIKALKGLKSGYKFRIEDGCESLKVGNLDVDLFDSKKGHFDIYLRLKIQDKIKPILIQERCPVENTIDFLLHYPQKNGI